ncbi:MAG: rod shape-determining protein MreC [Candidatus Poribacteria bacterium]
MSFFAAKYKNFVILICLCIISLILIWSYVPSRDVDAIKSVDNINNSVKNAFIIFIVPNQIIELGTSYLVNKLIDAGHYIAGLFRKPIERDEFDALISSIESLNIQLDEERRKNKELEQSWELSKGLKEADPAFIFIPARVIAVDPTDWFRYVTINKGRNQGIKVDMAVITQTMYPPPKPTNTSKFVKGAVVGKVISIQSNSARVQLITDRLSVVAVTIGPQKDLALLRGRPENEDCTIEEIPSTTHELLNQGDPVIVDERSSIFPPGMLVGWIKSIDKGVQFCHIEVQPAFKFSRLNNVLVILNSGRL